MRVTRLRPPENKKNPTHQKRISNYIVPCPSGSSSERYDSRSHQPSKRCTLCVSVTGLNAEPPRRQENGLRREVFLW
jgi:hypothetical protein